MIEEVLQIGKSLDCGIICIAFVECAAINGQIQCLDQKHMKFFRQQYVIELWANEYFWYDSCYYFLIITRASESIVINSHTKCFVINSCNNIVFSMILLINSFL